MSRDDVYTPDDIAVPEGVDVHDLDDYQGTYARTRAIDVEGASISDTVSSFKTRQTRDDVLYRTLNECRTGVPAIDGAGLVICRTHLVELWNFRFAGRVLRVRAVGVRERLHSYCPPSCGMCAATVARGNICHRDACATPLHPQWPAVYCSNECALEDL